MKSNKKKLILWILLVFAILFVLTFYFSSSVKRNSIQIDSDLKSYEKRIKTALFLSEDKNPSEFLSFMESWPASLHRFKSLGLLGYAYLKNKKYDKAIEAFEKSLSTLEKEDKGNLTKRKEILFYISRSYQQLGQYDKAIQVNSSILKWFPKDLTALCNMGYLFLKKEDLKSAEKYYKKAFDVDSSFKSSLSGLAQLYKKKNDLNKSLFYYKKLVEKYSNYSFYYKEIADIYLEQKKMDLHYEFMAKTFFVMQNYQKAISFLKKITSIRNQEKLHHLLISNLIQNAQLEEAEKEIQLGIKNKKVPDSNYLFHLAVIYHNRKWFSRSQEILTALIKKEPQKDYFFVLSGHNSLGLKDEKKAILYYEQALRINPKDIRTREKLAQIFRINGDKDKEYFHQALVYFFLGEVSQALAIFSWINEENDIDKKQFYYYKAILFKERKKIKEAISSFQEYFKIASGRDFFYIPAAQHLMELYTVNDEKDNLLSFKEKLRENLSFLKKDEYESLLKDF